MNLRAFAARVYPDQPLVAAAGGFLAVGRLGLADLAEMDEGEWAALLVAAHAREVATAVRAGQAAQGEIGLARVQAELDGGEAFNAALLRAATDLALEAVAGRPHAAR